VSELIAQAHDDAVADTIGWVEKHAAYTRRGAQGIAQVDSTGFIAAAFTHRDSRAGDPDLRTHVAVSNKVCTRDGNWLSLDGRALFENKVAASERYNTRLEALLTDPLRRPTGGETQLQAMSGTRVASILNTSRCTRRAAAATASARSMWSSPSRARS